MIRERGEDLPRESCFGFVVMVVMSCWRFLEVRRKVRGEKPNLRVFYFCYPRDATQAYHQLELHPESRYITTFSTHAGLYRYKRLNYGTNASAEIFQYTLQTHLQGLNGVAIIADDIIVLGANRTEHDENLDKCLKRLSDRGFTLNGKKCKILKIIWNSLARFSVERERVLIQNVSPI